MIDFCETLISFQTADRFVQYCVQHLNLRSIRIRQLIVQMFDLGKVFKILNKFTTGSKKKALLWQLKGVPQARLDSLAKCYFEEELRPNVITPMVEVMKQHQKQGDVIYIISGGYDLYIHYFAEYYNVNGYLASTIGFTADGRCTGKIVGTDCMREEKVSQWKKIKDAFSMTICYSDSQSDIPILTAVDQGIVVSHGQSQIWTKNYKLEELIWN